MCPMLKSVSSCLQVALLLLGLTGCVAGSNKLGQQWIKPGATVDERSAASERCLRQSGQQAVAEVDPTDLGNSISARKYFSRACMEADGWQLQPESPPLPRPTPKPRWTKDGATQKDFNIAVARCRVQLASVPMNRISPNGGFAAAADAPDNIATRDMFMNNCMVADSWELR